MLANQTIRLTERSYSTFVGIPVTISVSFFYPIEFKSFPAIKARMNDAKKFIRPRQLLRDRCKQTYYKGAGEWTSDLMAAKDFPEFRDLIAICERYAIADADVVAYVPGGNSNSTLRWLAIWNLPTA